MQTACPVETVSRLPGYAQQVGALRDRQLIAVNDDDLRQLLGAEYFFTRSPRPNPPPCSVSRNPVSPAQIGQRRPVNHDRVRPIVGLLGLRCPAAVLRMVAAFIVDAINRVGRRWARPHVLVERQKAVQPSLAHGDALPCVLWMRPAAEVTAPSLYRDPRVIFCRLAEVMQLAAPQGSEAIFLRLTPTRRPVF